MNASETKTATKTAATSQRPAIEHRANESEAEYLGVEAEAAKAAIQGAIEDIKANLGKAVDPRLWTRKHPWVAVGAAAASGFVAATVVAPRRGESYEKKLNEVLDTLKAGATNPQPAGARPGPSISQSIMTSVFDLLKVSVTNFVLAALRGGMEPASNGHAEANTEPAAPVEASEQTH